MANSESKNITRRKKSFTILLLFVFIIGSTIILFQFDPIRDLFGLNWSFTFDVSKIIKTSFIIIGSLICLISFIYLFIILYRKIPISGDIIDKNIISQKKKFLPRYRITHILQIKGLSHKNIKEKSKEEDTFSSKNWDIITSIARVCDEISYWIIKSNNSIKLFFTISGWSWFSEDKAKGKAKNSTLSLIAAFNNRYPAIKFESAAFNDAKLILNIIKKCKFGLLVNGIPTLKTHQTQIDRLINTFNSINEDCYYVVNLKGIRKDFEAKNKSNMFTKKEGNKEYNEDFIQSKKTGQSLAGIYAYSETEHGMHTILAAILSIWSGSYTFNVEKLGGNKKYYDKMQKLNPIKYVRLSNKTLSSFIHLPEKPYFTEDTDQPTFEIPSIKNDKTHLDIKIGNIIKNDRILNEFSLPLSSFLFNIEIVGMIGRGKSFLVASIIEQLLKTNLGCLIFDLKGEYTEFFASNPNVAVYTIGEPAPLGINLFDLHTNTDVQNVLALICEMLNIAGAPLSPTMLNIFESALMKVIKKNEKNLKSFMRCLHESSEEYNKNMKTSYSRDSIDAILNRINFIFGGINNEVFNVYENTIDFTLLDQGKKIILDFSEYLRRGANTASIFLVCNLLLHLLSKFASQKGITNHLRYLVILEEAMYLIPKRYNLESSASIGYSEQNFIVGRSLGIGTITIYQLWDSVSSVVHANSLTKILFRGEDVEKIRTSVNLTEEQFNYLTYLPDRHYILKSKSISRPALLKTIDFKKIKLTKEEHYKIIEKKFYQKGITQERIEQSLMEMRKEIFEKSFTLKSHSKKSLSNHKINAGEAKNHNLFNEKFWEWCINTCPVRIKYSNEKSYWIKSNICKKMQYNAQDIVGKLLVNKDNTSLIEIINKNPEYLVKKILKYSSGNETKHPKILTFCIICLILNKLKVTYNLGNAWKNNTIQRIKGILKDRSLSDYPVI